MGRMGRPPLGADKRTIRIDVYLTPKEAARLDGKRGRGENRAEALRRLAGIATKGNR